MTASLSNRPAITGYVTPQHFGPFAMPVPAQNSCLREYAATMGFSYGMPQCEHIFSGSYMQLFSTLNAAPPESDVAMYSFHMVPTQEPQLEELLRILRKKKLTLHFVLEKKIVASAEALKTLAQTLRIAEMIRSNDARLPALRQFVETL